MIEAASGILRAFMGDDRRRSWREMDQARERGRSSRDPSEQARERASKTAAYSQYKTQLDQLFKPGGAQLPESMRDKLGPASPEAAAQRARLEALREGPSDRALAACLEAGDPLPAEPRLLMSLLDLDKEAHLQAALQALLDLVEGEGDKPSRGLLIQRIEAVKNKTGSKKTLVLAKTLRAALDG